MMRLQKKCSVDVQSWLLPGKWFWSREVGESLWRESVDMAPDEGSEKASFFLYEQYERDDKGEARKWLEMSAELGYPEAVELLR